MPRNQSTVSPIKIVNNNNRNNYQITPNEGKRTLSITSTPPSPPSAIIAKKTKFFVTPNRYEALNIDDDNPNHDNDNIGMDSQHETFSQEQSHTTINTPKPIRPYLSKASLITSDYEIVSEI